MPDVVLDASALLAFLNNEPGAEIVMASLPEAAISSINLSEVVSKLSDAGMPEEAIRTALEGLPMEVVPFDEAQAFQAGVLRASTKGMGLSLGDRGCLSLAKRLDVPALTTDRAWEHLSPRAKVRMIR